jgi:hypothetical protein
MKHFALLIGATALGFAAPALAKPGNGHGGGGCPPGLAKKAIPCVPPGQAKKMYGVGQSLPLGVADPYSFGQIPPNLRSQYGLNPYGSYYYGNGYLYRVDPRTMLIQQVIGALLH